MNHLIEVLVLGLYVPIILFSGASCWLLIVKLLLPALRARRLDVEHYAVGISCVLSLAAHFGENIQYGTVRWFQLAGLGNAFLLVGAWKLLILASSIFAVVALNKAESGVANLRHVTLMALIAWALGALAATRFV